MRRFEWVNRFWRGLNVSRTRLVEWSLILQYQNISMSQKQILSQPQEVIKRCCPAGSCAMCSCALRIFYAFGSRGKLHGWIWRRQGIISLKIENHAEASLSCVMNLWVSLCKFASNRVSEMCMIISFDILWEEVFFSLWALLHHREACGNDESNWSGS